MMSETFICDAESRYRTQFQGPMRIIGYKYPDGTRRLPVRPLIATYLVPEAPLDRVASEFFRPKKEKKTSPRGHISESPSLTYHRLAPTWRFSARPRPARLPSYPLPHSHRHGTPAPCVSWSLESRPPSPRRVPGSAASS
eukprot:5805667-Prymnesium_polylepis.1